MALNFDQETELEATHRAVAFAEGETVAVTLERLYDAAPRDVWAALTEPDRLRAWFSPVTGDLREGGSFQIEGNAGGEILACERPTWVRMTFGGPESVLDLSLAEVGERTALELRHSVPLAMAGGGAGALYVGPGWDGALMGLGLYLRGEEIGDPAEAANSPEVIEFNKGSIERWVEVVAGSGTATAEALEEARAVSVQQFTVLPE